MTVQEAQQILATGQGTPDQQAEAQETYYGWYAEQPSVVQAAQEATGAQQTAVEPPEYESYSGYNPAAYATKETAEQMANYLGGAVVISTGIGPNAAPPEPLVVVDGVQHSAGLLAATYAMYPRETADAMFRAEQAYQGRAWEPPSQQAPFSAQSGTTPPTATPQSAAPEAHPGTVSQPMSVVPGPPSQATQEETIESQIQDLLAGQGPINAHQWGWAYGVVTGSPAPAPEDINLDDGNAEISFTDWWRRVQAYIERAQTGAKGTTTAPQSFGDIVLEHGLMFLVYAILLGGRAYARA